MNGDFLPGQRLVVRQIAERFRTSAMSLHFDDVQFRPVETTPDRPVELYMAWRKDNESPILQAFIDLCLAEASPTEPDAR